MKTPYDLFADEAAEKEIKALESWAEQNEDAAIEISGNTMQAELKSQGERILLKNARVYFSLPQNPDKKMEPIRVWQIKVSIYVEIGRGIICWLDESGRTRKHPIVFKNWERGRCKLAFYLEQEEGYHLFWYNRNYEFPFLSLSNANKEKDSVGETVFCLIQETDIQKSWGRTYFYECSR